MEKASEPNTLDSNEKKENIAKPIIELSESQPLKTSAFSIFFFLKYFSCTSSNSAVIETQSLGDAIAQATLELQEQAKAQVQAKAEELQAKAESIIEEVQSKIEEAQAQAKDSILDPTTVELLINVVDGVRVVTEKQKEEIEEQ